MTLNYEQKCLVCEIYNKKEMNLNSLVKYIYEKNQSILSPIEKINNNSFKRIPHEEYIKEPPKINTFIIEDQDKFFIEIDNFFVLMSFLEETNLVIKLCNPYHYHEILNEKITQESDETYRDSITFNGTYKNQDSSLGTPTFSLVKWKPSLLLIDFIHSNYLSAQELHNKKTSKHSIVAISIALTTSIISILLTLFTFSEPEKIDYDKLITGYKNAIEIENSKLIYSVSQSAKNIQSSIEKNHESLFTEINENVLKKEE